MEEYVKIAEGYLLSYGVSILLALAILIIGMWIAKVITKSVVKLMTKREVDGTLIKFVAGLVKAILYIFVIIAAIDKAGIESTSFVAILGAAGLAVGFALQGWPEV